MSPPPAAPAAKSNAPPALSLLPQTPTAWLQQLQLQHPASGSPVTPPLPVESTAHLFLLQCPSFFCTRPLCHLGITHSLCPVYSFWNDKVRYDRQEEAGWSNEEQTSLLGCSSRGKSLSLARYIYNDVLSYVGGYTHTKKHAHTHTLTHIYIYIYIYRSVQCAIVVRT
jgi:hypothetical protein